MLQSQDKVIRCNKSSPTPYVKEWIPKLELPKSSRIIDLGCGNGRNSEYLKELGYSNIHAYDLRGDYGIELDLIINGIPLRSHWADLILCNYLMCFLNQADRVYLSREISRVAQTNCFLLVEFYKGKQTLPYDMDKVTDLFKGWSMFHSSKDRFITIRKPQ